MLSSQTALRESLVYQTESMSLLITCFCTSVVFVAVPGRTGAEKFGLLLLIPLSVLWLRCELTLCFSPSALPPAFYGPRKVVWLSHIMPSLAQSCRKHLLEQREGSSVLASALYQCWVCWCFSITSLNLVAWRAAPKPHPSGPGGSNVTLQKRQGKDQQNMVY